MGPTGCEPLKPVLRRSSPIATITFDDLDRAGEVEFEFIRSPGPGGQNVNKVSTGVRLRFNIEASSVLPEVAKARLAKLAGRRVTQEGVLLIQAQRHRTQERNRQEAVERLMDLIARSLESPKPRRPTKPTTASEKKRLEAKRRRGQLKRSRRPPSDLED